MCALVSRVVAALERIAPRQYADLSWDNVGLLVDAVDPPAHTQNRVGLALDLTTLVVQECVDKSVGVLVCYHPAIFPSVKCLKSQHPKQKAILLAIRHGIAIISPHTALDNCPHGINSWIAKGILKGSHHPCDDRIANERVASPADVLQYLDEDNRQGGKLWLNNPLSIARIVERMKLHFDVQFVRCALGVEHTMDSPVRTIGICAGSGSSVLGPYAGQLDCVISGEISHHEILRLQQSGTTVLLVEHGTSERGYLENKLLPRLEIVMRDIPLENGRCDETFIQTMKSDASLLSYC
ncbi:NGG1 interacting factor [Perkinsela sp. CCAP 1560/4]|nr:NGG1 interacting factor [Perkinsela sp. CCAP 1560/4]|eukprot:KNH04701.1 NGG1 interacting factor [Perkinsela sp. CCAP 1560/4]